MSVYKCPICDGKGFVPKSFYEMPGETVSFAGYREAQNQRTACMSCFGRGVILDTPLQAPVFCSGLYDDKMRYENLGQWEIKPNEKGDFVVQCSICHYVCDGVGEEFCPNCNSRMKNYDTQRSG